MKFLLLNLKEYVFVVYGTPGSCIDQFVNTRVDIFGIRYTFVCDDFNIDLLKWNEHKLTTDFCNKMFRVGLRPLALLINLA